tara:strand:- start:114775 stop:115587 length:813 start_codon:yes stop_codon:yes gene_type:complete
MTSEVDREADNTPFCGPYEQNAAGDLSSRIKSVARNAMVLGAGWGAASVGLTAASAFALGTLRIRSASYLPPIVRTCSKFLLGLQGVDVEIVNPEFLAGRKPRLVFLNHTSQLDMFLMGSIFPSYGTTLFKREILFVPFFGWAIFAFDVPTINRKNLAKAIASLERVAKLVTERSATVFISPEGTRSRDGKLGPFKKGPFHLAAQLDATIVVAVIRGAKECQPMGQLVASPGLVRIELVAEIPTKDFTAENVDAKCAEVRAIFARELGEE